MTTASVLALTCPCGRPVPPAIAQLAETTDTIIGPCRGCGRHYLSHNGTRRWFDLDGEFCGPGRPHFKVTLTERDEQLARKIGQARQDMNERGGRGDGHIALSDPFEVHVRGALGELVVAKALKHPWANRYFEERLWQQQRRNHDVGPFEITTTHHADGRLIVQDNDPEDVPFILVRTHLRPVYVIVGWLYGREGKHPHYWIEGRYDKPAFYVPNDRLRPINAELLSLLSYER